MGYNGVPEAGETVVWQPDEKTAKSVADEELARRRAEELSPKRPALTLEAINQLFKNEAAASQLPDQCLSAA